MKKLDVGILGLGKMGQLHMKNTLYMKNINVKAVADSSKKNLSKAKKYGITALYKDYKNLLNDSLDLDAVLISLPNFLHHDSIVASLENDINVFIEKPMANNLKECKAIQKAVKKSGKKLMVGHNYRFVPAIKQMKQDLENGHLGELQVFTSELVINGPFSHPAVPKPVPEWWFDGSSTGGGVVLDLGYHMIDLLRFFYPNDLEVLFADLDYKMNLPMEDGALILLKSKISDLKGFINVGWYQKTIFPRFNYRTILHGDAGYVTTDELIPHNLYIHAMKVGIINFFKRITGRAFTPLAYSYHYEAYYRELEHFYNAIINDTKTSVTEEDGMKIIELIDEIYNKFGGKVVES